MTATSRHDWLTWIKAVQGFSRKAQQTPSALQLELSSREETRMWVNGSPPRPTSGPCRFEMYTQQLGLREHEYAGSLALRRCYEEHKNSSYVPEWLFGRWRMDVDPKAAPCNAERPADVIANHSW